MIEDKDRSGWIGASDTKFVVGNWNTKTFQKWWLTKLGLSENTYTTKEMSAGTNYEHQIVNHINDVHNLELTTDRQIILEDLRLRVNLDAEGEDRVDEIKTYRFAKGFDLSKHKDYIAQVRVEGFAKAADAWIDAEKVSLNLWAYGLEEDDYINYFNDIDPKRLSHHQIKCDMKWIDKVYLPRLKTLAEALKRGTMPR